MSFRSRLRSALVLTSLATLLVSGLAALPWVWLNERSAQHSYYLNGIRYSVQMTLGLQSADIAKAPDQARWFADDLHHTNSDLTVQVVPMDQDGTLHWDRAATAGDGPTVPVDCRGGLFPPMPVGQEETGVGISSCGRPEDLVYQFRVPADGHRFYVVSQLPDRSAYRETARIAGTLALGGTVGLLLVLLLSGRLARGLQRPITRAAETASRITGGERGLELSEAGRDELAALGRDFNTMTRSLTSSLDQVRRSEQRQRHFVGDVAHELRTPVATLLASSEALARPEQREQAVALVVPQIERLAQLTTDLLEIARIDEGSAPVRVEQVDLDSLVAQVISASPWDDRTVQHGHAGTIACDPVRVGVVLRNLLLNASVHGAPPVAVRLTDHAATVDVEVSDAGAGVAESLRERVFDRFVQGDDSRNTTGSGLGLSLARENARLLGGDLTLDESGRSFLLTLPRRSAAGQGAGASPVESQSTSEASSTR